MIAQPKIAVIGLGYVGMPLALEFSRKYPVTGFDISRLRVAELLAGSDHTLETDEDDLRNALSRGDGSTGLSFTADPAGMASANVFIITVPTPVDKYNNPDLTPLLKASETVGTVLKPGDVVIYESTVYPGCTEEDCIPMLEKGSGLKYNRDFFCGYSPERINPGDKDRTLTKIKKVTSGSTPDAAAFIDGLYASIIPAGTHLAASIRVAEAAKVIENAQRDINIAFVNELSKIFNLIGIDTKEVLAAASTKWNFLPFQPGLVGGHCIGVDPYYLAQKATAAGYYPEIILSGRRINDSMGAYVADEVVKLMVKKDVRVSRSRILVLGITFKENCPDVRNTKAVDIVRKLKSYHADVHVYDPWANCDEVKREYAIDCLPQLAGADPYDAVILAVGHRQFEDIDLHALLRDPGVVYDVKGLLDINLVDGRL